MLLVACLALRFHAFAGAEPRAFSDTAGYLRVSRRALASPGFWLAARPFGVPLVYKAAGRDPRSIAAVQWALSVTAWGVLAVVAARRLRCAGLRPLALASLLAFGAVRAVAQWDAALLSESLALSLTALLVAAGLRLATEFTWRGALLAGAAAGALVGTRPVYGSALLLVAGLLAAMAVMGGGRRRATLGVAGGLAALGLAGVLLGQARERWLFPSLNVLAQRILPREERLAHLAARGMPVNAALLRRSGQWASGGAFLRDPELDAFRRWWRAHGRSAYAGLLLAHPAAAMADPFRDRARLLAPRLDGYEPAGFTAALPAAVEAVVYPGTPGALYAWGGAVLLLAAVAIGRRGRPEAVWLVPALLLASAGPFAGLIWHADAMEVERHALPVAVQLRLGLLLLFWLSLDRLLGRASPAPAA